MRRAVIISAVRTPVGRYGGGLRSVRPDDLGGLVIQEAVARSGVDPDRIEDVYFGDANQAGESNRNVARMAALLAGLPATAAGCTVNRLCASGLEAINIAARLIEGNSGDVFVAGGVESMSRAPLVMLKSEFAFQRGDPVFHDTTIGWRFTNPKLAELYHPYSMGETAENVAKKWGISREDQDAFALHSQMKCKAAMAAGKFTGEIVPVSVPQRKRDPLVVDTDEHPRADTTLETLAKLRPAFAREGTVTAGNASGINDGASAVVIVEEKLAEQMGLTPLAAIGPSATAGVDPAYMGIGPVPATEKVLARAGLTIEDIDAMELNEAFAAQSLACIHDLKIDPAKVNPLGGAIALGHPLGCSGARLVTTLVHEMQRSGHRRGIASMCVGVGQGVATLIERV